MASTKGPSARDGPRRHRALLLISAVALIVAGVAVFATQSGHQRAHASQVNCSASPSNCGYPDATNAGVRPSATLQAVPGKVTSGSGWSWNATTKTVVVSGSGASITGLDITGSLNITASNVTVNGVQVTDSGGNYGISLRHAPGATIENSTVAGADTGSGRVEAAISDVYSDSTGMVIKNNNISNFKTAIQVTTGTITGNYIHSPGYVAGDHTNGILDVGTSQPLTISHNTILNSLGQTDAVSLDATLSGQTISNKTVEDNLLGGGGYTIYGGTSNGNTDTNITITGNDFSQAYYPTGGQFGPVSYFSTSGSGNTWSGNTWDKTGKPVPAP
jgi:hypothetical protein